MAERRTVELVFKLDTNPADSETTCIWAGPYVLMVATSLPQRGLALEVHSTFVGHRGLPTYATHLILGPVGNEPAIKRLEHGPTGLDPTLAPRQCVYEHAGVVLETLKHFGYEAAIDVPDNAFEQLERVAP